MMHLHTIILLIYYISLTPTTGYRIGDDSIIVDLLPKIEDGSSLLLDELLDTWSVGM